MMIFETVLYRFIITMTFKHGNEAGKDFITNTKSGPYGPDGMFL